MILTTVFYTWFYLSNVGLAQNQKSEYPIRLPTAVKNLASLSQSQSQCFSPADVLDTKDKIRDTISNFTCGGSTGWTRVVHLNMSDTSHQCPLSWSLVNTTVRGCGRLKSRHSTCDSVTYSVNKMYSSVCGRIVAYQKGIAAAFVRPIRYGTGIESAYVSGVSLTHGRPGSRQHIWTFAGALYEQSSFYHLNTEFSCPCTNTIIPWNHMVPVFIDNDYFCATGNSGPHYSNTTLYQDDPLWDGKGCGLTNTCCEFNHPPWMLKTLPYSTSDDLELRLCTVFNATLENKIITMIELYVK